MESANTRAGVHTAHDLPGQYNEHDRLEDRLTEYIAMVEGDPTCTMEALAKFYQAKVDAVKKRQQSGAAYKKKQAAKKTRAEVAMDELKKELEHKTNLSQFVAKADNVWERAIELYYKHWQPIAQEHVSDETYVKLFDEMAALFPLHAEALLGLQLPMFFWQTGRFIQESLDARKSATCNLCSVLGRYIAANLSADKHEESHR